MEEKKIIEGQTFEEERSPYGLKNATVKGCFFMGEKDGESPLKECENLEISDSFFNLRYHLWHLKNSTVDNCEFTDKSRAPFWYTKNTKLTNSMIKGIKFLRECDDIDISYSDFFSPEFGWQNRHLKMNNCYVESEYPFLHSTDLEIDNLRMNGKYSFQYVDNATIRNSYLVTKDAFWHTNNVTVIDSVIDGEYLGWYSRNLKFINCHIKGTQPLCYADNLVLENCTMESADLAFENSTLHATIKSSIISIKNPISGLIEADEIGNQIFDDFRKDHDLTIIDHSKIQDK